MSNRLSFFTTTLFAFVLAGCAGPGARSTDSATKGATVTGTVAYRERIVLPADAVVEIRLADVSRQDVASPVIAETTVRPAGQQVPIPFELRYDPGKIEPNRMYAVRATISSAGRMMFTTTTAYPVITRGNPTQVNLMLPTCRRSPKQRIASNVKICVFRDTMTEPQAGQRN